MLDIHNEFRAGILNGTETRQPKALAMPPLKWNQRLASKALEWSQKCVFQHNADRNIPEFRYVGENIFMGGGTAYGSRTFVTAWYNEIKYYNYDAGTCSSVCGHYTQVVWADTTELGCGKAVCSGSVIVVCNYGEGGNYSGRKPYVRDPPLSSTQAPSTTSTQSTPTSTESTSTDSTSSESTSTESTSTESNSTESTSTESTSTDSTSTESTSTDSTSTESTSTESTSTDSTSTESTSTDSTSTESTSTESTSTDSTSTESTSTDSTSTESTSTESTSTESTSTESTSPESTSTTTESTTTQSTTTQAPTTVTLNITLNFTADILTRHNEHRQSILSGSETRQPQANAMLMLSWNAQLAALAQTQANTCSFQTGPPSLRRTNFTSVGNNIYVGTRSTYSHNSVVDSWYAAISGYNYDTNTCTNCQSYRQVVSAKTTLVGCGIASCSDKVFAVCYYSEPAMNERPYVKIQTQAQINVQTEMLNAHNILRQGLLSGTELRQPGASAMPNLIWNTKLAEKAQTHADTCSKIKATSVARLISGFTSVGENIFVASQTGYTNQKAVDDWYGQIVNYNYAANTCQGDCSAYTQIIWAATTEIGCGVSLCNGEIFTVCDYAAGGNTRGQKPYAKSRSSHEVNLQSEMLSAQNGYRQGLVNGLERRQPAAASMSNLVWDTQLAQGAQALADSCTKTNNSPGQRRTSNFTKVGQNIFVGPTATYSNSHAVETWYNQLVNFNYLTAKCTSDCSAYLQLVWAETKNVGCGLSECGDEMFAVCNYADPIKANKQPYVKAPSRFLANLKDEALRTHNNFRNGILNGTDTRQPRADVMPSLVWNDNLAANAQKLADECSFQGNTPAKRKIAKFTSVGQNIYASNLGIYSTEDAVAQWYSKVAEYNYALNTCETDCTSFYQVVLAATTEIGCGVSECPNSAVSLVCDYGEGITKGKRPYEKYVEVFETNLQTEMVQAHETYRAGLRSGTETRQPRAASLPALTWDKDLATGAARLADSCTLVHDVAARRRTTAYREVGQNIFIGTLATYTNQQAMDQWYEQIANYTYSTNRCSTAGSCNYYLQLVWANTVKFGCGVSVCPNNVIFTVCNYGPTGAIVTQKPYRV